MQVLYCSLFSPLLFYLICLDRCVVCIEILIDPEYYSLFEGGFQGVIYRRMLTLVFNHWTICKTNGKAQWEQIKFSLPLNIMQITIVNTDTFNR